MFSQVQEAHKILGAALDGVEQVPTAELRQALGLAKQLRSRVELLETKAASLVAQRERHGDGGAGLLNQVGGLSRSDAARNARTDSELAEIPAARTGLSEGEISFANAARLAHAARKTSPQAVQDDPEFVELAKTLPADEFAKAAQQWAIRRQSNDELAAQHRRNRRNRNVRFWSGDDGSVQMRGSFDAEMGARIQSRLRQQAELLRQADRRRQRNGKPGSVVDGAAGGPNNAMADGQTNGVADGQTNGLADGPIGGVADKTVRTRDQRMADALDGLLTASGSAEPQTGTSAPTARLAEPQTDADDPTARIAEPLTQHNTNHPTTRTTEPQTGANDPTARTTQPPTHNSTSETPRDLVVDPSCSETSPVLTQNKTVATHVIIRADLEALLGEPGGVVEIPGIGPIPPNALQRLACNSDLSIVLFGDELTPLWEATPARAPTAAQRRALIARDGACVGCGAPPGECEAHHVHPWKRGGKTRIDNLVLVCWFCHDRIHDHNWRVVVRDDRYQLVPPDAEHQVNPAPSRKPKHPQPADGMPELGVPSAKAREPAELGLFAAD